MTYGEWTITKFSRTPPQQEGPRANDRIRAEQVRVIDAEGEMLGVLSLRQALLAAEEAGMDLIEISPNAEPPVCRIGDLGKYRYDLQKKAHAARKKQKVIETKELKFRPNIDDHDLRVKTRSARKFLEQGNKVRFFMLFRGRQAEHKDIGWAIFNRLKESLAQDGKIEMEPKQEGNSILMIMGPLK